MSDLPFNPLDLVVLGVILVSGLFAFFRGLVHEVLAIAGWVGAALITIPVYPVLTPFIAHYLPPLYAGLAAAAIVFLVALIVLTLVSHTISARVRASALGGLDRTLGFVFGLVRGFIIVCIGYLALGYLLEPPPPGWIAQARTRPALEWGGALLWPLVPGNPAWPFPDERAGSPARPAGLAADPPRETRYNPAAVARP